MFAERLTYLRKSARLTQQQLADALGVSRSTIGMYEKGQREPNFETLESIADLFNVRMDSLIGKSEFIENKNTKPTDNDRLNEFIELCSQLSDDELDIIETLIDSLLSKHGKED